MFSQMGSIFSSLLLTFLLSSISASANPCESELVSKIDWLKQRADRQKSWASVRFSDPSTHSNSYYLYLIHGVIGADLKVEDAYVFLSRGNSDPEKEYIISASLISSQNESFPDIPAGFIFKVVPENILAASYEDINTYNSHERASATENFELRFVEYQEYFFSYSGLFSPKEIIAYTNNSNPGAPYRRTKTDINEVALLNRSTRPNPITGIFISNRYSPVGIFKDKTLVKRIQKEARDLAPKLGLPLVVF